MNKELDSGTKAPVRENVLAWEQLKHYIMDGQDSWAGFQHRIKLIKCVEVSYAELIARMKQLEQDLLDNDIANDTSGQYGDKQCH